MSGKTAIEIDYQAAGFDGGQTTVGTSWKAASASPARRITQRMPSSSAPGNPIMSPLSWNTLTGSKMQEDARLPAGTSTGDRKTLVCRASITTPTFAWGKYGDYDIGRAFGKTGFLTRLKFPASADEAGSSLTHLGSGIADGAIYRPFRIVESAAQMKIVKKIYRLGCNRLARLSPALIIAVSTRSTRSRRSVWRERQDTAW
jgi:hypothetical protein